MTVRALIVDDEPHAREGISIRLKEYPDVQLIGECSSGLEAVQAIQELNPDLLFLDIQMPEMNGIEVVQRIMRTSTSSPIIVFVTAYDKYAIKAFEYHALDYLLKPISDERFHDMIKTVLAEFHNRNLVKYAARLQSVVNEYMAAVENGIDVLQHGTTRKTYLSRLMVKTKETIAMLPVEEVEWMEAAGDYVYVHANTQKHIIRETLVALEQKLDPQKFIRIHRSVIVNVSMIKTLRPNDHGDFEVLLKNGTKLKLSRTYKANLQKAIGSSQ